MVSEGTTKIFFLEKTKNLENFFRLEDLESFVNDKGGNLGVDSQNRGKGEKFLKFFDNFSKIF